MNWERNIPYTFSPQEGVENGLVELHYKWKHTPSSTNGVSRIYVNSPSDVSVLIAHWNTVQPGIWEYSL